MTLMDINWNWQDWFSRLRAYLPYILIVGCALAGAELAVTMSRRWLIPSVPPPPKVQFTSSASRSPSDYFAIIDRNIFNLNGEMPQPIGAVGEGSEFDESQATPSNLPIQLMATIIHSDRSRSIAALYVQSAGVRRAYHVGDSIEGMAEIVAIRRGRVFLRSESTQRFEYIDLPVEEPVVLGELGARTTGTAGIVREGERNFRIERSAFEAQTADLGSLLQQARAVPNMDRNGQIDGFKVENVQKGSVFESLGIQPGDVVKSVNGQKLDNVRKAMEMYNTFRHEATIEVEIEHNGETEVRTYSIR